MINPHLCYALSFTVAVLIYQLGWSSLHPNLSFGLLTFLVVTVTLHFVLANKMYKRKLIVFNKVALNNIGAPLFITGFLYLLWTCDFIYEGGIPLIKILLKLPYDYRLFGIPSIHVFIVTFSSFYTVFLFHIYLSNRNRLILLLYFINLFAAILIYNRGMLVFNLAGSLFLFLTAIKKIPKPIFFLLPLGMFLFAFFFGVLGTLRVAREVKTKYDNTLFMDIGHANISFVKSAIPKEFFWTYIYATSPIANFQHNLNTCTVKPYTVSGIMKMINNELLLDFISKRINTLTNSMPEQDYRIPGPFNVSTVYSRSYNYFGWLGVFMMTLVVLFIPWLYTMMISPASPFFLSGAAILCTMFLFLAFDNTIRFTGLSFQLIYPILLTWGIRRFSWFEKMMGINKEITHSGIQFKPSM